MQYKPSANNRLSLSRRIFNAATSKRARRASCDPYSTHTIRTTFAAVQRSRAKNKTLNIQILDWGYAKGTHPFFRLPLETAVVAGERRKLIIMPVLSKDFDTDYK